MLCVYKIIFARPLWILQAFATFLSICRSKCCLYLFLLNTLPPSLKLGIARNIWINYSCSTPIFQKRWTLFKKTFQWRSKHVFFSFQERGWVLTELQSHASWHHPACGRTSLCRSTHEAKAPFDSARNRGREPDCEEEKVNSLS